MRGFETQQTAMFSYVSLDERVPSDHPLRRMQVLFNGNLASMSKLFDDRYSHTGRPSIPPEQLLRALLLQILFTGVRQLNLIFREFLMDSPVFTRVPAAVFENQRGGT